MRVSRAPEVFWDVVDGRTVVCDGVRGELYHLNPTAAFLWRTCDDVTEEAVAARLVQAFPGHDAKTLAADARSFLESMSQKGLLVIDEMGG